VRLALGDVRTDYRGFEALAEAYHRIGQSQDTEVEVDLGGWIDGNMCGPLGAALFPFYQAGRKLQLTIPSSERMEFLQRNGFLPNFGFDRPKMPDTRGTTIEYQRFEPSDAEAFKTYVARHFVGKGIPDMSSALHSEFRKSISEIFDNAVEHSGTELGIFACGQHYPRARRLDFSIADLGIGMRENIFRRRKLALSAEVAIAWAMAGANTTRRPEDRKPGGFGLKLIRDFITLNDGRIQIASDAGYWSFHRGDIEARPFARPFPGTVVNIEIHTADAKSYRLTSEIDPNAIF